MSREESLACVVTWWHQEWHVCSGLFFGLPLAVTSFNRVSRFTEAVGRRLLYVLTSLLFDDAHITDWASSQGHAQASFSSLNLLGTPMPRRTMHPRGTNFGLDFDFSAVPSRAGSSSGSGSASNPKLKACWKLLRHPGRCPQGWLLILSCTES